MGIERTRPVSGASTRKPPPRQKVPGLQARPKDKKQLMLCSPELVPGTVLSIFFYQGFSSAQSSWASPHFINKEVKAESLAKGYPAGK